MWGNEQKNAFALLKKLLCNAPILIYPNFKDTFILQTDASKLGIGCALFQERDNVRHPIAFYSRTLNTHERNYSISALEALALVFASKKCRNYVYQNNNVIIETDHKALEYISKWKGENSTIARWWIKIMESFDKAKIVHISGAKNVTADFLSRVFKVNLEEIIQKQKEDDDYKTSIERSKEDKKISEKNGIVYFKNRIYIPKQLRVYLLHMAHDENSHIGINKTIKLLTPYCYWQGMQGFISRYCKTCEICQKKKINRQKTFNFIGKHEAGYPWKTIHMDYVGPLQRSDEGNKYILTVIDRFSKFAEAFPVVSADGETTAKIIEDEIIHRYGIPEVIFTDRGTHFLNANMDSLLEKFDIKQKFTTAFNPQSNGICERLNATLVDMLRVNIDKEQSIWDKNIRKCLFNYNSTVQNNNIKVTPYEVLFGFCPKTNIEKLFKIQKDSDINSFIHSKFKNIQELFNKNEEEEDNEVKHQFLLNQLVLVKEHKKMGLGEQSKFINKFKGPFEIVSFPNNFTAKIKNVDDQSTDVVHLKYLKKYNVPNEMEFHIPNDELNSLRYPEIDTVYPDTDDNPTLEDTDFIDATNKEIESYSTPPVATSNNDLNSEPKITRPRRNIQGLYSRNNE